MLYLVLIIQLPVIILISYYLNSKKIYTRNGNIYITSFFEGFGSYLIIISLILEGFIVNPVLQVLLLIIGLIIIAYTKNYINETEPEIDLQIETMKNLIVLFSSTILLFFVMLSVFRFQHFFLQFLYALLVVIIFNFLAIYLKRWFSNIWDRMYFNNSKFISFSAIYIYIFAFVLLLMVIFINFPKVSVNKAINLNNSNSYFVFPNGSIDLVNRYEADKLIDVEVEMGMDMNAYINQDADHVFIYIHESLIIFDSSQEKIIYSGIFQEHIDGIEINPYNEETNEIRYQSDCLDESDCNEYLYPFKYGDVKYKTFNTIVKFDNLDYKQSDTAIFSDDILHLFKDEKIDSRVSTSNDKPLLGFSESTARVTDIDNYDGSIFYLQVEKDDEHLNIKVYKIIENDIDVILPFYSHYRFGMLVFIFILGFIPITNYDMYRTEVH